MHSNIIYIFRTTIKYEAQTIRIAATVRHFYNMPDYSKNKKALRPRRRTYLRNECHKIFFNSSTKLQLLDWYVCIYVRLNIRKIKTS